MVTEPRPPNTISDLPPIQSQLSIGRTHFMFGRMHTDIADAINVHYRTKKSLHSAQSVLPQYMYRMWTKFIRPQWNARNKIVHAMDQTKIRTAWNRMTCEMKLRNVTTPHSRNSIDTNNYVSKNFQITINTIPSNFNLS